MKFTFWQNVCGDPMVAGKFWIKVKVTTPWTHCCSPLESHHGLQSIVVVVVGEVTLDKIHAMIKMLLSQPLLSLMGACQANEENSSGRRRIQSSLSPSLSDGSTPLKVLRG